jgi:predicted AAA+ superfamily ATPase
MAQSNRERVGNALDLLVKGLQPFVERELQAALGKDWVAQAGLLDPRAPGRRDNTPRWDSQALLTVMWDQWNAVFRKTLGQAERTLVSELRDVRNKWAHQEAFSTDDAYRALDSMQRLLTAVSAEEAQEVDRQKQEVLRVRFEEQTRQEKRRSATAAVEGQPAAGLKPWREIVMPHHDVASGRYQQAEFAADLGQVHRGEGADEYRNPTEFFRRTFLTDGLKHLLVNGLLRLSGKGGDPVVELQTNFGGGKTHSMLALYHLFSGVAPGVLPGIEPVLKEAGVAIPPQARRAVLVGTAISPGQAHRKPDGTEIHTLWGELAWQLLGKAGFSTIAQADKQGVSPGSDALRDLFKKAGPCLVLIDEWVAFLRQLYGKDGLPAGSFDANLTFAQALTEAARAVPNAMVVVSVPASEIEIGGGAGKEAVDRLMDVLGRVEAGWRPANAEEGFEIVRRRLFQPITDPDLFKARDAAVRAFAELYWNQSQEFPTGCSEGEYERRMTAAYPIHPELFDRLYNDWSSLDKFQRTRGVLRLMAAVIHSLWEGQDASLLILPATVPIHDARVRDELTRYLDDPWVPVIEKDVDGPQSLPLRLDRDNPNLGRYSACRRVARTLYLGSAPTLHTANRGLEDRQIKLGSAQPGEAVATFGDALRRLTDQATHLYVDGRRYWYSTQPSVARLAQDRAAQQDPDKIAEEITRRLREQARTRGEFAGVHSCPASVGEVPDDPEARLVILGPEYPHVGKGSDTPARKQAAVFLDQRGTGSSPRENRNMLVFLAADRTRLNDLDQAVRQYLAWKSIANDAVTLNLDAFQSNQAKTKCEQADETVVQRIPETYVWLLVPGQGKWDPNAPIDWQEIRLQGQSALAVRASKKLGSEELLITEFAGTRLKLELDRIPLWRGDHVSVKQLAEDFAKYLYLPRFKDSEVLVDSIRDGLKLVTWQQDSFACADGWDAEKKRYRGLRAGQLASVVIDGQSVLVKPDVAAAQLAADTPATGPATGPGAAVGTSTGEDAAAASTAGTTTAVAGQPPAPSQPHRFHGSVSLDPARLGRDAGKIAEEVVQHLAGLLGAKVEVTLEISAEAPDGVPDNVVRTVTENCRTLRFRTHGFEEK